MKAIILAAGQGKRLRPLTNDRPKCMVEFAGTPLLDSQISTLRAAGVGDIVVVGGWQAATIKDKGTRQYINEKFDQSNMVQTLFCAADEFDGLEDLLILYSDILYETRIVLALSLCEAEVATTVDTNWRELWQRRFDDPLTDAETLKLNADGSIKELGKEPKAYDEIEAQYMGMTKVAASAQSTFRDFFANLPDPLEDGARRCDIYMTDFLQLLIDSGQPIHAVKVHSGWIEIDDQDDLAAYQALIDADKLTLFNPGS